MSNNNDILKPEIPYRNSPDDHNNKQINCMAKKPTFLLPILSLIKSKNHKSMFHISTSNEQIKKVNRLIIEREKKKRKGDKLGSRTEALTV